MSDSFLEEQVRRIRQLTERMAQMTERRDAERASAEEQHPFGPLHDVRDVRIVNSVPTKDAASDSTARHPRRRRR